MKLYDLFVCEPKQTPKYQEMLTGVERRCESGMLNLELAGGITYDQRLIIAVGNAGCLTVAAQNRIECQLVRAVKGVACLREYMHAKRC